MVVIKVTYGNDIRRITIDGSLSYKDLRTLLKKLHHNTLPAHFEIKYLDDENDKVTISCDRELAEALEFVQTAKQPLLRVILSEGKKKEVPATAPLPTPPAEAAFSPNQLLEVIEAALSSPEVQQTWETVQGTFTTCVDQAVREGRTAAHYVQQHPQFARVQHLLTERLPQAIHNDLNTTLPQLVNDIQGIFANISIPAAPRPPVPAAAAPATPPVVHHAICDACEKHIVGIRYKCTTCPDFDLCEACEAKPGTHDSAHYFLKLRTQLPWGLELTRIVPPSATTTTSPIGRASRCPYFQPQQQHQHQQQQQQQDRTGPQYQGPRPRHHFGRGFTLSARFVSDVSIDDGTVLAPNATFVKVWRLRNDGERAWPEGTTLTHLFGPRLAKVGAVSVPALPAGEEVDIAVEMVAPSEAGHYVSNWRLAGPRGYKFGHRIWADITVQPVDVPAAEEEVKPAPVEAEPQEEQPAAEDSSSSSDSDEEFEVVELEKVEEAAPVEAEPQEKVEEVAQPEPEPEVEQPAEPVSIPIEAAPVPVPAPTPAPAPEGEEDDMVRLVLDQLEQMGFQDRARNNRLLLRNRGNVLATIHQLLDM